MLQTGAADVTLATGSYSARDAQFLKNGQRWVTLNVVPGHAWRAAEWNKFGDSVELEVQGLNPIVIKAYYFPRIDLTLFVNVLKDEVSHWRIGKANR